MALLFDSWLLEMGAIIVALFVGIYIYMTLQFQHWKKKNIPYIEPSFPFGTVKDIALQRMPIGDAFTEMYWKLSGHKYGGTFQMHKPGLLVRDPDLIKTIFVKDFANFHDRGFFINEAVDPLSGHLFFLGGTRWKHMRYKLTPTFTSGKMKMMFPTLVACSKELKEYLAPIASRKETVEIKDVMARFSTDVIATCAFGIESNCLRNPDSAFREMGRNLFQPTFPQKMKDLAMLLVPKLAEILKFTRVPQHLEQFFLGIVKETIDYREKFQVARNDFMQLLINIKNNKDIDNSLEINDQKHENEAEQKEAEKNMYDVNGITTEELAAQALVFFAAGFETSSTTISFCLYELALNQDIQDRLRDEIDSVMADHGGELTYEVMMKMEYLDMVVAETLRKYPPVPILNRACTKEYQLPGTETIIECGTPVVVPVYALHHDPQYYPNPEEFDPERFTEEAKSQRHHYVYLPFGEGPRICIAYRFGLMQTKLGLASVLSKYQFKVCKKLTAIPLVMDPTSFIMSPKGGINLQVNERIRA